MEIEVFVYLENIVGGDYVMVCCFDIIVWFWDVIGDIGIGFCLDICYIWVVGEVLIDVVDWIKVIIGCIDLVYCNDFRDEVGLGCDCYVNFGSG